MGSSTRSLMDAAKRATSLAGMISRRTSSLLALAATAGIALIVTACAPGAGPASAPTSTASPSDEPADLAAEIIGAWTTDATGDPHLDFTADGAVTGTDGCNGISTTYTVAEDRVELAPFASTMKACQGVDDWLRGVRAVEIDGEALIVLNAAGEQIGELSRAE